LRLLHKEAKPEGLLNSEQNRDPQGSRRGGLGSLCPIPFGHRVCQGQGLLLATLADDCVYFSGVTPGTCWCRQQQNRALAAARRLAARCSPLMLSAAGSLLPRLCRRDRWLSIVLRQLPGWSHPRPALDTESLKF